MPKYGSQQIYNGNGGQSSGNGGGVRVGVAQPVAGAGQAGAGLVQGLGKAGGNFLEFLARDYNRRQKEKIEDTLLFAEMEFERWKKDYNETHRGVNGQEAGRDYVAAWADIAGRHVREFGGSGHEIYPGELNRGFFKAGLHVFREGARFEEQQKAAWDRSRHEAREAAFLELCKTMPEDTGRLEDARNEALGAWMRANPGLDPGGYIAKLNDAEIGSRTDSFAAAGDEAGLASMLSEKRVNLGGMPENVATLIRETAKRYNIPENLALAQAMQESSGNQKCVSDAGAIGVMQLMPGTARDLGVNPHDVRQNIEGGLRYLAQLRDKYGNYEDALYAYNMGPGAYDRVKAGKRGMPRETRDYVPRIMGRMGSEARLTPIQQKKVSLRIERIRNENRRRQEEARREAEEARVQDLVTDTWNYLGRDQNSSLSQRVAAAYQYLDEIADPEIRGKVERKISERLRFSERSEKAREEAEVEGSVSAILAGTSGLGPEQRQGRAYQELEDIRNGRVRQEAERRITQQLSYEDRRRKALDAESAYNAVTEILAKKLSPIEARAWLQNADLTPAARALAMKQITPQDPRPNMQNIQALESALVAIDRGGMQSPEERRVYAINHSLSHTQYATLMHYSGKGDKLSLTRLKTAARAIGMPIDKMAKSSDALFRLYNQVLRDLPDGKPASTADLEKLLASYIMTGSIHGNIFSFGGTSYAEAVTKGQESVWMPDITSAEIPEIDKKLREHGKKITTHNRKKMKKFIFGRADSTDWE